MVAAYIAAIERGLSPDRLEASRPQGGDNLAMATTYFWNIALCQSLYASLGTLEVSMRNGIHDALTAYFGNAAWYDTPNLLLTREADQIADVKQKILRARKPLIPPRAVGGLNYGFWTSILDSAYGNTIWTATNPAFLVQQAFPHAPLHYQVRTRAHDRFNTIRTLRNRVSHHEPIWRGVLLPNGRIVPAANLYADAIDAIGWVDPTLQASHVALDRFPIIHQNGRVMVEWEIKRHLGIL